jgi:hypothetical protein
MYNDPLNVYGNVWLHDLLKGSDTPVFISLYGQIYFMVVTFNIRDKNRVRTRNLFNTVPLG